MSKFEPNRITNYSYLSEAAVFKTMEKSEFRVLIKHCFLIGKKYYSSKVMA